MAKRVGGFINQDGLNAPDEPTGVSASAGDAEATVSFTAPSDVGASAITGYVATSNDGIGAAGSSSPITVSGLTNGSSYTFRVWAINAFGWSAPSDSSGSVSPIAPRGVFAGGTSSNVIDYIDFNGGNATDFGDITATGNGNPTAGCGSATRGLFSPVGSSARNGNINYITFSTTGNALSFGSLGRNLVYNCGCSNDVRGLFAGGVAFAASFNNIDYVTIATTGSTLDFGDLDEGLQASGATAGTTRGIFAGGYNDSSNVNTIQYVTIASTGNATNFGDLTAARSSAPAGVSSSVRAVFGAGLNSSFSRTNIIDYVTIASTGNATDFGDLPLTIEWAAGCSNSIFGVFGGGSSGGAVNNMSRVTISTTGNATDFGDLTVARTELAACSNVHGGIS